MDEFFVRVQPAYLIKLLLDEVFNSLYVVVSDCLDILDALCILFREVMVDIAQLLVADGEALQLRQGQVNEGDEVFHLHANTITDKGILGEVRSQRLGLASVSPVNRRNGSQHIQFHIMLESKSQDNDNHSLSKTGAKIQQKIKNEE